MTIHTPGMVEITAITGRKGALSLIFIILVSVVLTVLDTGIEWAAVFEGVSGSSEAKHKRKQGLLTLPLSDEPPSVHDSVSSIVFHTNATREVILIQPDMQLSATIFKFFFDAGCFTMRNKASRNNCKRQVPKTKLDKILKNIVLLYHPRAGATAKANCLLFNLRHPVDRVVSWYKQVHPENCEGNSKWSLACQGKNQIGKDPDGWVASFFERCFPTIEDLAESFAIQTKTTIETTKTDMNASNSNQTSCNDLAYKLFQSGEKNENAIAIDAASNFRYYHNKTLYKYPEKEVWVLRSENVLEDLDALEVLLGGVEGQYDLEYAATLTRPITGFMQKQIVPKKVMKLLCCALRDEFVVVNDVLHRAANFNNVLKYQAWSETLDECGFGSWTNFQKECKTLVRS
jgi:hypothetical protein